MHGNFTSALNFIWDPTRDGQAIHLTPGDQGGWTAWGCTYQTWASWRIDQRLPCALDTFKTYPQDGFKPLYYQRYWAPCDGLPGGIDLMVFDAAVLSGLHRAIIQLQQATAVDRDGIVGPQTMKAVLAFEPTVLINRLVATRLAFVDTLEAQFRSGWRNRITACQETAQQWTRAQ